MITTSFWFFSLPSFFQLLRPASSDKLVGTGQGIEQGCLAAVRVAGKRDLDSHCKASS